MFNTYRFFYVYIIIILLSNYIKVLYYDYKFHKNAWNRE